MKAAQAEKGTMLSASEHGHAGEPSMRFGEIAESRRASQAPILAAARGQTALKIQGRLLRRTIMTQQATIYISQTDRERLGNLIELVRNGGERSDVIYVNKLEDELELAEVLAPENIPPDVVTMRSKVKLKDLDTKEENVYSIVFPSEANSDEGKISVLAPLATALLGSRRGATVEFKAPGRLRRLQILEILYQPESAGDFNL